ncbi:MAG: DUF4157 domain-containing protein [Cyanobacteria bacterium SBLK]|nr:DUF4157 domain-containing protein [Cyanobacteria bacterium SBLK]
MFSHQKRAHNTKKTSREHFLASKPSPAIVRQQKSPLQRQSISRTGRTFSATEVLTGDGSTEVIQPQPIQTKLAIGEVGDRYEREADRVAKETVQHLRQPLQKDKDAPPVQQRPISPYKLQRREELQGGEVPTELETQIDRAKSGGQSLAPDLQGKMGRAMGTDFSHVKVHTDSHSDRLNQSLQARAFTTGNHVFFKKGEYSPNSTRGQELLAHELTHVVQQNGGEVQRKTADTKMIQCGLFTKKKTDDSGERIEYVKSNFEFILQYPPAYEILLKIAQGAYVEEGARFLYDYLECERHNSVQELEGLYDRYIQKGQTYTVNISSSERRKLHVIRNDQNQTFSLQNFAKAVSEVRFIVEKRLLGDEDDKSLRHPKNYKSLCDISDKMGFSPKKI